MATKATTTKRRSTKRSRSQGLDPALVKALAHPLRMRVLSRLNEIVASPKELADEFGVSLPMLSYHFRVLAETGAIELVRETQVRGAIEHHYRATTRAFFSDEDWALLPATSRQGISKTVLDQAFADLTEAFGNGTFDARADRHLSFSPLVVDEEGWARLRDVLADAMDQAATIQAESAARLQADQAGGAEVLARMTIMLYEGAPGQMSPESRRKASRKASAPKSKRISKR